VRDGQVVKGVRFRDHKVVGDILDLAARYRDEGADELVFYDISASPEGRSVDRSWVTRVARILDIPFCVAGGIRSVVDAEEVLASGAEKISINSPALTEPDLIDALSERFGAQCVVVGIDSQTVGDGYRVQQFTGDVHRTRDAARDTLEWVVEAQRRGAGEIVLNCMASDGVRHGYDIAQLRAVRAVCRVPLVASGGAGAVLMLAYMNREALDETLSSKRVTFWSRSKNRLWTKGETSGNFLELRDVAADCDNDTLLVLVKPVGPACHTGTATCWGNAAPHSSAEAVAFLGTLEQVITDRIASKPEGSYTAKLLAEGTRRVAQKVGEEGLELALAAVAQSDHEVIGEAADLVYHTLLLLKVKGLSLTQVVAELQTRHAARL
jgi:cyclase